jgi:UDP-N-acetylmuramyl pentapeptide phosphotransferase/UDP-N-acetylglucosamine-1-phosphate transferase
VTTAAAGLLGLVLALVGWPVLRSLFERPAFRRTNYRGVEVATAGGLVLIAAVVVGEVVMSGLARYGELDVEYRDARRAVVAAVVGFGLLGLLDDLTGDTSTTGYRGHLRALLRGEVTTGALKIIGGGVVALACTAMAVDGRGLGWVLADAALVALSANLANLFDRRPGRVGKVTVFAVVVLCLAGLGDPILAGTALVGGATLGLLLPDLREQLMVGDTGANPMGAAVGLGVVVAFGPAVRVSVLVLVLALNLVSERVSFTAVIERTGPLRFVDQLGRRP